MRLLLTRTLNSSLCILPTNNRSIVVSDSIPIVAHTFRIEEIVILGVLVRFAFALYSILK